MFILIHDPTGAANDGHHLKLYRRHVRRNKLAYTMSLENTSVKKKFNMLF